MVFGNTIVVDIAWWITWKVRRLFHMDESLDLSNWNFRPCCAHQLSTMNLHSYLSRQQWNMQILNCVLHTHNYLHILAFTKVRRPFELVWLHTPVILLGTSLHCKWQTKYIWEKMSQGWGSKEMPIVSGMICPFWKVHWCWLLNLSWVIHC